MDLLLLFLRFIVTLNVFLLKGTFRLTAGLLRLLWRTFKPARKTFGSARWARLYELILGGVWGGNGLIVGKYWGRFIKFNQDGYAIVFAPTRSGKGVGIVVPNLLNYKGSIICVDPKSENHAVTSRYRATLGDVVTLDAIHPERSDCFNPLDMVRVSTYHEADDALEIAKLLVIPDSQGGGHWDNRATQLIQTTILYTCLRYATVPELRNLAKVRSLIALGADGIKPMLDDAMTLGSASLRESLSAFARGAESEELRSVFANADKAVSLWAADRPAGMISMKSDFRFEDFNRRRMTAYIIVDEEKLAIYAGFMRMMTGCALMAMTRAKEEAAPKVPTLLLFDEAAALGRIEPLETGVGYLATYARMILVFQDLDQLQRIYPKARSMIANAGCRIAFGVNDIETAKMLEAELGPKTTVSRSQGQSQRNMDLIESQQNQGVSEAGRSLLDASEIMRLPRHKAIVSFNGPVRFPILAGKVRYFKVWRWKGRWDRWRGKSAAILPFPSRPAPSADDQAA